MTIKATLLARGYLPKELPPSFYSDAFAVYASSRAGRAVLSAYRPAAGTECVAYNLAMAAGHTRELRIPHPATFAKLADIAAKHFGRLLRKAHRSPFSRSKPSYSTSAHRSILPSLKPGHLPRERAKARVGAAFLAKADISHFYPTLYTHAVGWVIDPRLRERANWGNRRLLGKRVDQALMDLQGKVSQGLPIGNDLSFLFAESILGEVDRRLRTKGINAFRWYDDYEFGCDSHAEGERILALLRRELARFRLRLNPAKTCVTALPLPVEDEWRALLIDGARSPLDTGRDMVRFFDSAFRIRSMYPEAPVLLYALGILFKVRYPSGDAEDVAISCITQSLLAEPGIAQKAFALLRFWTQNGMSLDRPAIANTIARMIANHDSTGLSSDISWALFFCIESQLMLSSDCGRRLSDFSDDAVAIQALHMEADQLFSGGFTNARFVRELSQADPNGEHWLAAYEFVRQGHGTNAAVSAHGVFGDMLSKNIPFYRTTLPQYASLLHPGGAPEWAIHALLAVASRTSTPRQDELVANSPVLAQLEIDVANVGAQPSFDELVARLFGDDYKATMEADATSTYG